MQMWDLLLQTVGAPLALSYGRLLDGVSMCCLECEALAEEPHECCPAPASTDQEGGGRGTVCAIIICDQMGKASQADGCYNTDMGQGHLHREGDVEDRWPPGEHHCGLHILLPTSLWHVGGLYPAPWGWGGHQAGPGQWHMDRRDVALPGQLLIPSGTSLSSNG